MRKYAVSHRTVYVYSASVALCHSQARLRPRDTAWQRCHGHRLEVSPVPAVLAEREDFYGNAVTYLAIQDLHQTLEVMATSEVSVQARPFHEHVVSSTWEEVCETLRLDLAPRSLEARQFVLDSPFVTRTRALADYASRSFTPGRALVEAALDLNRRIHAGFRYEPGHTTVATPLDEVMASRRGVCQDFAHLAIGCLRSLGLAARYVSGYLETRPPPGREKLAGADATHAWVALYVPDQGWVELDPTNDCLAGECHVVLAWGRDYGDVAPLGGVTSGGGAHDLSVAVDVVPAP